MENINYNNINFTAPLLLLNIRIKSKIQTKFLYFIKKKKKNSTC